ncbi:MAG: GumC family protein [Sphingomonadaceae bacterium]
MNLPDTYNIPQTLPRPAGTRAVGDYGAGADGTDGLSFSRLVSLFRRRIWLFLIILGICMALGLIVTMLQTRMYEASSIILLQRSNAGLEERVTNEGDDRILTGDADVATEIKVIESLDLARRVVEANNLMNNPAVNPYLDPQPGMWEKLTGNIPAAVDPDSLSASERKEMETEVVRLVRSGLVASRLGTSYSVGISYHHTDPEIAALLANSYARQYVMSQVTTEKEATDEATEFLASKITELRSQATEDFAAVQAYRVGNNLLSNSATSLTEQDISVYNQQVASARADASADAARLATARQQLRRGSSGDDVGEALSSSVVSSLRAQRAQVGARVADLRARYGNRHPDLQRAEQELASIDRQIQEEIDRVISNLEAKANVSAQRLASLQSSLGSAKGELARNNRAMVSLEDLEQRAEASQALYETYLARYRQLLATTGTEQPYARILTEAIAPVVPVSPNITLNLLFAALFGAGLGFVAALGAELQYKGITTAGDVTRKLNLPYLGLVPEVKSGETLRGSPVDALVEQPQSVLAESLRGIYASTHIPGASRATVLAISSALPDEGKTTLSAMMGITAFQLGRRVVIVDCDVISRGLSKLYGLNEGQGLQDLAEGHGSLDDILVNNGAEAPSIVPCTGAAGAGVRLSGNGAIHSVIASLRERYDLVLLDCPPLLAIAEAREIAGISDGVILAARWRNTRAEAVRSAARLLPDRLSAYIGVVLTRVDMRKLRRYDEGYEAAYSEAYERYMAAA